MKQPISPVFSSRYGWLIACCLTLLLAPAAAFAAPITLPPGLSPGAPYRLAFETSGGTDAMSPSISTYNSFVNSAAGAVPALAELGPWTAIASAGGVSARDNTSTNPLVDPTGVPIYTLQGTLLAATNSALWSGTIANPLDVTETGATAQEFIWTGTKSDGTEYTLADFPFNTGSLGYIFPECGSSQNTNATWIAYSMGRDDSSFGVYGISAVLTAPVPEPGALVLAALGGLGLFAAMMRKRG